VGEAVTTSTTSSDQDVALTPDTSDVPPKYLAVVAQEDPGAVLDLLALVPASKTSTAPTVYKRQNQKWVLSEQYLMDLTSPTPPPVVKLQGEDLNQVLKEVDGLEAVSASAFDMDAHLISFWSDSLTAAGGLDRNRGNAEKLRRYWVHGEGAAKIRWGTQGDWARCVRHLEKYLGERAKGYCQLRHKEAMGIYTATHAERDRKHG
jgi:hypothetical protein